MHLNFEQLEKKFAFEKSDELDPKGLQLT